MVFNLSFKDSITPYIYHIDNMSLLEKSVFRTLLKSYTVNQCITNIKTSL